MHSQVHIISAEDDKIPTMPSRIHHKPWPGRKVTKVDEVVNYKSTFPGNLHPLGKGDAVQGKAVKVGVLDWSSLEKWTYFEKHVANSRGGDSSSSSNSSSSPFSTSVSSSQSVRSIDSPLSQRKQSRTLVACQNPYSGTLLAKASIRHNHEHDKINKSDIKGISHGSSQHPDIGSSSCTPKIRGRSAFSQKIVKMEFPQSCEQSSPGDVHLVENDLPDQRSLIESMRDCLDQSDGESSISLDSSMKGRSTKLTENSMTEIFPPNGIKFVLPSPQISYSCPLPVSGIEVPIAGGKEDHSKLGRINHGLFQKFTSQAEVKMADRPKRDLSPQRLLRAGINRIKSSSSSSGQQIKQSICLDNSCNGSATSSRKAPRSLSPQRLLSSSLHLLRNSTGREGLSETDNSIEDTAASNVRSRRSPLRRMFDPLKSKTEVHFSGPITSLPSHQAEGASTIDKLPIHNELKSATTRQALVKLAWKNGLPLFVFSSCDANVLVATIGKGANGKHECTYAIFTDHIELKKNCRVWTSPIKKNKRHDSADNTVISQMRVSSLKSTKEFVLYVGEQTSTTNEQFSPQFRDEVAAIVIQDQGQIELKNEKLAVVAILPSGVHGISSAGEPSPLIERWKSGGSCDCGGWDEGCMLTVLSGKNQETSTPSNCLDGACTADEAHRIELFTQGETKENKHAFSMITFKEGVYTVDFRASISSLQAFGICIAILHGRKPMTLSGLHYSVETIADHASISSASYEYHPPLSPIGRA